MSVESFYDGLSPYYHLIYADCEASVARQAAQLDSLVRELFGERVETVLDATCGIGTQAIGLASLGYRVTASDISAESIERARSEAAKRELSIDFSVADVRRLSAHHRSRFDVVIACDNSIPHLLDDDEIRAAFRELYDCTVPGGGLVISVRDYDPADREGTRIVPFGVRTDGERRFVIFQVWEFKGPIYELAMYFVEDGGGSECTTRVHRSRYYAIPSSRLLELMSEAGFRDVRRIDGRFFQPILVGRRNDVEGGGDG